MQSMWNWLSDVKSIWYVSFVGSPQAIGLLWGSSKDVPTIQNLITKTVTTNLVVTNSVLTNLVVTNSVITNTLTIILVLTFTL